MFHVFSNGLRIGYSIGVFQNLLSFFLHFGFAAASAQLTVGEVDEEIGILFNSYLMMKWKILTALKSRETIDDYLFWRWSALHHFHVEQDGMSSQSRNMPIDCWRADFQIFGYLPIGHAAGCFHDNLAIQFRELLPIGGAEGLCAEGDMARLACKPLDTTTVHHANIKPRFFKGETFV